MTLGNLTFDCEDPQALSAFWSGVLGIPVDDGGSEFFASIGIGNAAIAPNWMFLKVPEGKTAKNRLHLDFESDDLPRDKDRLQSLGAVHVADKDEWGHQWSIMNDIEGNEFCLSGPHA